MIRITIILLVMLSGVAGCACGEREQHYIAVAPQHHLIFAPPPFPLAGESFGRVDWPAVYDGYDLGTWTDYRVVITDYQGLFDHHHDHYQRRFESVRGGVQRR